MNSQGRQTGNRLLSTATGASATEPEGYTFEVSVNNTEMHTRLVSSAIDHCVEPGGMTAAIVNNHLLSMFVTLHDRWPQPKSAPAAAQDKACPLRTDTARHHRHAALSRTQPTAGRTGPKADGTLMAARRPRPKARP